MSGQRSNPNQPAAIPMTSIQSQLECPVCLSLPRDLPIPSCPSGHFVCRPCKVHVIDCPICRQPMPANMTNSVVGALIEQVLHGCKFSDQGCEVKMMLNDLVTHEKQCPDRTFKCPVFYCDQFLKLKNFDTHALEGCRHSHKIDVKKFRKEIPLNNVVDNGRRSKVILVCIEALDQLFHVNVEYHKPSKCFVISIWLAKSEDIASKYFANVAFEGDHKKLFFEGIKVSSVENVPSIDKCIEEVGNISLCLPINLVRNLTVTKTEGVGPWSKGVRAKYLPMEFSFKKI